MVINVQINWLVLNAEVKEGKYLSDIGSVIAGIIGLFIIILCIVGSNDGFKPGCPKCGERPMGRSKSWDSTTDKVRDYYYCPCGYERDA